MFSIFSFITSSVSVFTVVPSLVVGAVGTESLFVTGVSLYVFVLYSNSIMYFPAFNSLNSYLPSLSVIAVISFPPSPFRYSATLSLLICFIFTKMPFNNFSFSSFIPSSFSSSHAVPEMLYVLSVGVSGLSGSTGLSGSSVLVPFILYSVVSSFNTISLVSDIPSLSCIICEIIALKFIIESSSLASFAIPFISSLYVSSGFISFFIA